MRWTSILAIYILFWSLSVFLALPFGVRTHEEAGADRVPGQADSAPHEYRFGKLIARVTVIATILFGLYYANYVNGWITPADLDFAASREG
jgi:predicted secreted protein